jgi:hypothetical protein
VEEGQRVQVPGLLKCRDDIVPLEVVGARAQALYKVRVAEVVEKPEKEPVHTVREGQLLAWRAAGPASLLARRV